jgi:hypothetical protein
MTEAAAEIVEVNTVIEVVIEVVITAIIGKDAMDE